MTQAVDADTFYSVGSRLFGLVGDVYDAFAVNVAISARQERWPAPTMRAPRPMEFRDDVVRVARSREDGVTIEQIAADFGVHPMTLWKWLRQADIGNGAVTGKTTSDSAELRELRRRNRLLEQENEVLRRAAAYLSQSNLPGNDFTRS